MSRRGNRRGGAIALLLTLLAGVPATSRAQVVYWLDTNWAAPSINRCNADGSHVFSLQLPAGSRPEGLAFSASQRAIYWTEAKWQGARLRRCNLDFGSPVTLDTLESCLRGLSADDASGWLYGASSNQQAGPNLGMFRWSYSGGAPAGRKALAVPANVRGVAADGSSGRVLFADYSGHAIDVASTSLSGTVSVAYSTAALNPFGIALDHAAGQLYFTDFVAGTITRLTIANAAVSPVASGLANPTYLAIDEAGGRLFWVESPGGSSHLRTATTSGANVTTLTASGSTYGGVVYVPASSVTAVDEPAPTALAFTLLANAPGAGVTELECALPRRAAVDIGVFDVQGREVARLVEGTLEPGRHRVAWETRGQASGVYFARLRTDGRSIVRRVVVR